MKTTQNTEAMSITEFCGRYGLGMTKVYSEVNSGRLIARKSGRRTIILASDAEAWAKALPPIRATVAA